MDAHEKCRNAGMISVVDCDCPNCQSGNDSRLSDCSAWVVAKVISLTFDTKEEAESFAETMREGFTHKNDTLIITQNAKITHPQG